jgi:hypothetical protein
MDETVLVTDGLISRYFQVTTASIAEARSGLWNEEVDGDTYNAANQRYQEAILEQYKVYVEMADRISARRALANAFFLSLNTAVLAAVGALAGSFWRPHLASGWLLVFPLVVLLVQTGAWFWLIRSYRQLNSAKYVVVGALEERLPASPYWRAEWKALGEGKDKSRYWQLTHLEQWLPVAFAVLYLIAFIVALAV